MSSAAEQIRDSFIEHRIGRSFQVGAFVDCLIALCEQHTWISGRAVRADAIEFTAGDGSNTQIELQNARGIFRATCARLATFAHEHGGVPVELYGGNHQIPFPCANDPGERLSLVFTNTTRQQTFRIERIRRD